MVCKLYQSSISLPSLLDVTPKLGLEETNRKRGFYFNEIINGFKSMIVGRKGIGKTAYASKLRKISNSGKKLLDTVYIHLNEIDFSIFKKIADKKYSGTQKYQKVWDWVIGIEILKYMVDNRFELRDETSRIIKILEQNEIYLNDKLPIAIRKISKKYAQFSFKVLDCGVEGKDSYISLDIYEFVDKIFEAIASQYFNKKLFIVFDGLDDLLRFNIDRSEMLAGLIRSSHYQNLFIKKNNINLKILILIREDILSSIVDPDINKIKRDSSIVLRWDETNLKAMVDLRIHMVNNNAGDNPWYDIFPKYVHKKNTWDFILDYTLLRPRDIFQFLNIAKEMFPNSSSLTQAETLDVLKQYSAGYFIEEIKDELSGFISDEIITNLQYVFQKIGETDFTYFEFKQILIDVIGELGDSEVWEILQRLIKTSAIGQISSHAFYNKKTKKMEQKSIVEFFYKSPRMLVSKANKFHIHRALYKALNFSINS